MSEKSVVAREKLKVALETAKETARVIQSKAFQGAKATDKVIRAHPYQSIGIAFCAGVLLGVLVSRK